MFRKKSQTDETQPAAEPLISLRALTILLCAVLAAVCMPADAGVAVPTALTTALALHRLVGQR